jgi:hypothetical protein
MKSVVRLVSFSMPDETGILARVRNGRNLSHRFIRNRRPTVGAEKDFFRDQFSARTQIVYILPDRGRLNAFQGPEISVWFPSPATHFHFFYRETITIYEFHQASVSGGSGTQDKSTTAAVQFTLMYRF